MVVLPEVALSHTGIEVLSRLESTNLRDISSK
jgi:hypothetical protein